MKNISFLFSIFTICLFAIPNISNAKDKYYRNMFTIGGGVSYGYSINDFKEESDIKFLKKLNMDKGDVLYNVNLKYKIYFAKNSKTTMFIAPEGIYNFGSIENNASIEGLNTNFSLKTEPQYGFKLSLGLETRKKHSFSIGGGIQKILYEFKYNTLGNWLNIENKEWVPFAAIDYEYNLTEYFTLGINLSYYFSNFNMPHQINDGSSIVNIKSIKGQLMTAGVNMGIRF